MKCRMSSPFRENRVVPSGRKPSPCWSRIATQRFVRGSRQWRHSPHSGAKRVTTWSPGATSETPGPTLSTTPAPSWPSTQSVYPVGSAPDAEYRSVWQTPQASSRTSASPALGSGKVDLLDDERLPELLQHGCPDLHRGDPTPPVSTRRSRRRGSPPPFPHMAAKPELSSRRRRRRMRARTWMLVAAAIVTFIVIAAGCGGDDDSGATTANTPTETTTGGSAAGAEVFASAGCGSCHTLPQPDRAVRLAPTSMTSSPTRKRL